jgi:hypothetical protein
MWWVCRLPAGADDEGGLFVMPDIRVFNGSLPDRWIISFEEDAGGAWRIDVLWRNNLVVADRGSVKTGDLPSALRGTWVVIRLTCDGSTWRLWVNDVEYSFTGPSTGNGNLGAWYAKNFEAGIPIGGSVVDFATGSFRQEFDLAEVRGFRGVQSIASATTYFQELNTKWALGL